MNKLKVFLFSMVLALASLSVQAQQGKKQTVQIKTSAVCNMCKARLEKAMAAEEGVKSSSLDVKSKVLTVVFDSRKTNSENIAKAVTETGYDADDKVADESAYNRLSDCCKKASSNH